MAFLILSFDAQEKRIRWFRPLVCLLAACFSILIFIVGTSTRYSRPFIRSLTVLSDENSRENENSETIYTSIQAPFNSSYEVSINPAYHVTSLMEEYYWGSGTQNGTVNAKRVVSFDFSKEQTLLSLENLTAFSHAVLHLEIIFQVSELLQAQLKKMRQEFLEHL